MAITITPGVQVRLRGTAQSTLNVAAVTTTATQTLAITADIVTLNGPTATVSNYRTMADGSEGQEILIVYAATGSGGTTATAGDIHIVPSNLRPQSSITFRKPNQYWLGKFVNGKWQTMERTTFEEARTTASAAIPLTVDAYIMARVTGTDQVFSLADGLFEGQRILLDGLAGSAVRVVTPTTMRRYTSLNMGNAIARYAELLWARGAWTLVSAVNLDATGTDHSAGVIVT